MKVLLINPNRAYPAGNTQHIAVGLPLGLLYVAAGLEKSGISVRVFDCLISPQTRVLSDHAQTVVGVDSDVLRSVLLTEKPDIVGIGCQFTVQWNQALESINITSTTLPQATIVLGGPHATVAGRQILENHHAIKYIVAGEGELTFPRLVEAISRNDHASVSRVPGLLWRDETGTLQSNPVEAIADLDELPLPAYHLIDVERLFRFNEEGLSSRSKQTRAVPLITSRGCPYTCTFCSIHLSMGYKWRFHSVDHTINHIRYLIDNLRVSHFYIEDDNFTFKRSRANDICRRMIAEGLHATWDTPNGVRADTLNEELIENIKKSGCTGLVVAAESGDQDVVTNIVKKKIDLESIENAAKLCQRAGLPLNCFFVVGFPGETKKNIANTFRFAFKLLKRYNCMPLFHVATPLPGTELEMVARENGYLVRDMTPHNLSLASSVWGHGMIRTPEFDPAYLHRCYTQFYYRTRLLAMSRNPAELLDFVRRKSLNVIARLRSRAVRDAAAHGG